MCDIANTSFRIEGAKVATELARASERMPVFAANASGIVVSPLRDGAILAELRDITSRRFSQPVDDYVKADPRDYQKLVADAQDEINGREFVRRISEDRRAELCEILGTNRILIQTNLYLRATRPKVTGIQENVGWHRESFYGPDMQYSVNLWTPIANVTRDNILRYIPDSHLIPDSDIATVSEPDPIVERFSAAHRIGLLYAPKRIVSGVDLEASRPFEVPDGAVAIFAGQLIHGAAENRSRAIRFSVDFRVIAADNLVERKKHFSSGKEYFEEL